MKYKNVMEWPDWFDLNGVYSLESSGMRVLGQKYVHIFNSEKITFVSREVESKLVPIF